jgi:hypothetical protein
MKNSLWVFAVAFSTLGLRAADWPQWRGPGRDGAAEQSPALLDSLPATGPKMLWEYALPAGDPKKPYYSSPVVAADKAYLRFTPPALGAAPAGAEAKKKGVDDVVVCVNMTDGKEVWKFSRPGGSAKNGAPNTPCVADGKLYFVGSQCKAFCLDAATGKEVWATDLGVKGGTFSSSILLVDGKLIVADAKLMALDAKTGTKVWENANIKALHSSPALWKHQGKTYILAGQGNQKDKTVWKTFCVDAATGQSLWDVAGGINGSPVVSGDILAMLYWDTGLKVYQLAPEGAKEIAGATPVTDDNQSGSPAVSRGRIYGFAAKEGFCYDTEKKDFAWKIPLGAKGCSPIIADGKVIQFTGQSLKLLDAATGKDLGPAKGGAKIAIVGHSSPALADGRLLVNAGTHLRCYDLRKP